MQQTSTINNSRISGHMIIAFFGDTNCGKSSLLSCFKRQTIIPVNHTICPDYNIVKYHEYNIALLDLPGDINYLKSIKECYINADAYVIVADATNEKSILHIRHVVDIIKNILLYRPHVPVYLILSKSDAGNITIADLSLLYNITFDFKNIISSTIFNIPNVTSTINDIIAQACLYAETYDESINLEDIDNSVCPIL